MKSRHRIKNIIFIFFTFLIVCIVLFCILEIFLRIYTKPFIVKIKGNEIALPRDKHRIWTFTHNFETDKLDKLVTVSQNKLGFRGADPPENFSEYLTIMTVGGSTTYNAFISDGKTWTDVLGRKLQKAFKNVWINNAGFNGHSTEAHILLLEQHITKLKPKILLFLVGHNDTIDYKKIAIYTGQSFDAKFKEMVINNVLEQTKQRKIEALRMKTIKNRAINFFKKTAREMSNYSEVFSLIITIHRNIKAYKLGFAYTAKSVNWVEPSTIEISEEDRRTINKLLQSNDVKEHLVAYEARLKKLIKLSRDNNIEPILITYPTLYGNGIDDVTKFNWAKYKLHPNFIIDGEHAAKYDEMANNVNRKVAAEEGLLLIELSRKLPKYSKYYIDYIHYSNKGNEFVADIIYDTLCPYLAINYSKYLMQDCDIGRVIH